MALKIFKQGLRGKDLKFYRKIVALPNGKQNHQHLNCGRQFVLNLQQKIIKEEKRSLIRQALLERVSLEGVCRIFNVSMPWLRSLFFVSPKTI